MNAAPPCKRFPANIMPRLCSRAACERAARSDNDDEVAAACARALFEYAAQIEAHFEREEQNLLPLLQGDAVQALVQRTLADHRALRGLLDGLQQNDAAALAHFGETLAAHVRFEERERSPAIERAMQRANCN
ncbi:MAG: hemerythrin domain-containing protein [Thiobacillus sp.]